VTGAVTRYCTFHYERTPSQVLGGVRSRFQGGKSHRTPREPGPPLSLEEIVLGFDPGTVEIAHTALRLYAKRTLDDRDDDAVEVALRSELAEAVATGTWSDGVRARFADTDLDRRR
jgi:hypothetical protein